MRNLVIDSHCFFDYGRHFLYVGDSLRHLDLDCRLNLTNTFTDIGHFLLDLANGFSIDRLFNYPLNLLQSDLLALHLYDLLDLLWHLDHSLHYLLHDL